MYIMYTVHIYILHIELHLVKEKGSFKFTSPKNLIKNNRVLYI